MFAREEPLTTSRVQEAALFVVSLVGASFMLLSKQAMNGGNRKEH